MLVTSLVKVFKKKLKVASVMSWHVNNTSSTPRIYNWESVGLPQAKRKACFAGTKRLIS